MRERNQQVEKPLSEGRDELNLADFPISVLQRQQPVDERGAKLDTAVYAANRYDRRARQQVQQKVTLETSSRHGLPTPADENVVLALLYVAKHTNDFADPVVHFSPRQLFDIMGWAPNSRSYDRLRAVLRRLQALVIRYENAWWDITGRAYEAEVATGIISEYEIGRQVSGPKSGGKAPSCWVCWTPHFQRSLNNGNLKKLDLERLFALKLPTAQRMYRFLDKRFYPPHEPPTVDMDLLDFACGHIGLTRVENVAELKRRLSPAIEELESIGFLAPAEPAERFYKVRAGVWRVRFQAGPSFAAGLRGQPAREPEALPAEAPATSAEHELVAAFYRLWTPDAKPHVGESDVKQARDIIGQYGVEPATAALPALVKTLRSRWPDCRSFRGAAMKYFADVMKRHEKHQRQQEARAQARQVERQSQQEGSQVGQDRARLEALWQALPDADRRQVEDATLQKHPHLKSYPSILKELCLTQLTDLAGK